MSETFHNRVRAALEERSAAGLRRDLTLYPAGVVNLANNDYFDLARSPELAAAAATAVERHGCSASASPLLGGYQEPHEELLEKLKAWYGKPHGLLWNSGFAANQAVLSTLPKGGEAVVADRLVHNSMIAGIKGGAARLARYRHLDLEHLETRLEEHAGRATCFVATESVFSMDGDYPDLRRLAELKDRYGFIWILDEAHAIGWYGGRGTGLAERCGVLEQVDVLVGTMGKALGSMGAFTLFNHADLAPYLVNFAREFIYSTYLPPASAAAASRAIDLLQGADREGAQETSRSVRAALQGLGYEVPDGDSPIIPVRVGDEAETLRLRDRLLEEGILVGAVRPPTVPKGTSRLRLSIKNCMDPATVRRLIDTLERARAG